MNQNSPRMNQLTSRTQNTEMSIFKNEASVNQHCITKVNINP